jgi:hypothetical protein
MVRVEVRMDPGGLDMLPAVRRQLLSIVVALAGCASGPHEPAPARPTAAALPSAPFSDPAEYAIDHISEAAGEAIFSRTGVGDPYRTGLPYPVFLALLAAYPDELGGTIAGFSTKFGFTHRPASQESPDLDEREGLPVGMHLTTDPNTRVPFLVTNCALCHAERVRWPGGEQLVLGIGNKRVRIHAYDDALARVARRPDFDTARLAPLATELALKRRIPWPPDARRVVTDATLRALRERVTPRESFLARVRGGLPGRVATIESFAVALGVALHRDIRTAEKVGWAKIPDVIRFPHARTLSWDGAGEGSLDALVVDADIAAGARIEWLWSHPWQGPSLSSFLRQLPRALRFPGTLDAPLARRGKAAFERACAKCHGTYADDGRARSYVERVVPLDYVDTDGARAAAVTDEFVAAANDPQLDGGKHLVRTRRTSGYVPPVLTSLWARAPYGHAGQWPSLAVLATRPTARPTRFVVHPCAPLDLERVGVAIGDPSSPVGECDYLQDATVPGLGAGGHPFLADLGADEARAVIEYLKTL